MGHSVSGIFLDAKTEKQAMSEGLAAAYEFAYYNGDREEGSDNYHGNFRYYGKEFDTEDEALDFFDRLGSYCDGIVKVRYPSESSKRKYNEKIQKLEEKKRAFKQQLIEAFKQRKSSTIGCKNCGSRYDNETALRNRLTCPNCRSLMISDGAKKRLKSYDDKIKLAQDQYKKSTSESGKLRYYAKFEVHC